MAKENLLLPSKFTALTTAFPLRETFRPHPQFGPRLCFAGNGAGCTFSMGHKGMNEWYTVADAVSGDPVGSGTDTCLHGNLADLSLNNSSPMGLSAMQRFLEQI
jgi:hypothetical protein